MRTSAPGKLFLIGEYAVLIGAPAVLVPVPCRAIVEITTSASPSVLVRTTASRQYTLNDALSTEPLFSSIVEHLGVGEKIAGKSLLLDTAEFFKDGRKLGLGSSAALTAALVRALAPGDHESRLIERAIDCHRSFQGGKGSGADIALAIADRPIRFLGGRAHSITLPPDLRMLAIWSGESASTTDYITRFDAWRSRHPSAFDARMERFAAIIERFIQSCEETDARGSVLAISDYDDELQALSEQSGLDFYNEPHLDLQKRVKSANCIYKPSGAGGGDFGIAFSTEEASVNSLARTLGQAGFHTFPLDIESPLDVES
jgi:mevalonate kinase